MFSLNNFFNLIETFFLQTGNSAILTYPLFTSITFSIFSLKNTNKTKLINLFLSFLYFLIYIIYFVSLKDKSEILNSISGWSAKIGIEIKTIEITRIYIFIIVSILLISSYFVDSKNIVFFWLFFFSSIGFIMTNDIFNMYVFFELFSISLYNFYISSKTKKSFYYAFNALKISTISGILLLLAIFFTYNICGSLNMTIINEKISYLLSNGIMINEIRTIYILFIFSMLLKCGIYPFCPWIERVYLEMENKNLSIVLSVASKVILYGLVKIIYQIFSYDIALKYNYFYTINKSIEYLAVFGIIIGSIEILKADKIKEIIIKSSIISNSYFLLCIVLLNKYAIFSFISGVMVESICKAIILIIISKYISTKREKSISFDNLKFYIPDNINIVLIVFIILAIANSPIAIGFLSKWYILNGVLSMKDLDRIYIFFSILFYSLVAIFYNWKIIQSVMHDKNESFMKYVGRLAIKNENLAIEYLLIIIFITLLTSITFIGVFKYGIFNEIKNSLQYYFY